MNNSLYIIICNICNKKFCILYVKYGNSIKPESELRSRLLALD